MNSFSYNPEQNFKPDLKLKISENPDLDKITNEEEFGEILTSNEIKLNKETLEKLIQNSSLIRTEKKPTSENDESKINKIRESLGI